MVNGCSMPYPSQPNQICLSPVMNRAGHAGSLGTCDTCAIFGFNCRIQAQRFISPRTVVVRPPVISCAR
jgi:hypothetical protein